jgi:hypothetical protein
VFFDLTARIVALRIGSIAVILYFLFLLDFYYCGPA